MVDGFSMLPKNEVYVRIVGEWFSVRPHAEHSTGLQYAERLFTKSGLIEPMDSHSNCYEIDASVG